MKAVILVGLRYLESIAVLWQRQFMFCDAMVPYFRPDFDFRLSSTDTKWTYFASSMHVSRADFSLKL